MVTISSADVKCATNWGGLSARAHKIRIPKDTNPKS